MLAQVNKSEMQGRSSLKQNFEELRGQSFPWGLWVSLSLLLGFALLHTAKQAHTERRFLWFLVLKVHIRDWEGLLVWALRNGQEWSRQVCMPEKTAIFRDRK